ncbi:MAG: pectate lyase [Verrucomicrobia bacterium]|nr:MAG: pectate lyase [Verrucomicrobiota bacterium]
MRLKSFHSPGFGFVRLAALVLCFAFWVGTSPAATWYVAPTGADTNAGAISTPFATITRAQTAAISGDTVYLRGGTYFLNNTNLTLTNSAWAIVNNISKSGISYLAYPGERPVFDLSAVQPTGWRVTAFRVTANNCTFKGFDVVGVQIILTGNNQQSECFRVDGGSSNRFEQLAMHDGMGIGWYLTSGASNLVLNCDAYQNRGLDSFSVGNIDGFGCHPNSTSGKSNVLSGCRAWFNSDDGFDLINAKAKVVIENCWAFYNGYTNSSFTSSGGDANGFKSGGYGVNGSTTPPSPAPRHVTRFCLAARNRANGFYANHHTGGLDWFNNTAYRNAPNASTNSTTADFNMLCNLDAMASSNDVPGFDHVIKNNLGYRGGGSNEVTNLGLTNDASFNSFTNYVPPAVTVASNDFMSLDESLLTLPRQADGSLPYIAFAQLVSSSDLVNAGTNAGFVYAGTAPDLGAFEYGLKPPPTFAMTRNGTNLIFTGGGGPAGGTNYLVATTNPALPVAQWPRVATNKFDLAGNYVFTNSIPAGVPSRFHRLSLP